MLGQLCVHLWEVVLLYALEFMCVLLAALQMATYDDANRMMTSLAAAAKLKAEAEDEAVNTFAQQQLNNSRVQLELWDWQYWRRQYKAATFGADESDIRQYLVVENVLNGYFQVRVTDTLRCM